MGDGARTATQLTLDSATTPETRIDPGDWDRHLVHAPGARLVVGGPGTGKTEFLARKAAVAVRSHGVGPERILVLSFSRESVADIRGRLERLLGSAGHRVTTATYHSLAMRLVEAHAGDLGWPIVPTVLTGVEQERFVADLLADEDPRDWPANLGALLRTDALAGEVTDFLLRAAEQGADGAAIAAAGRGDWRAIPAFLDRYRAALERAGRIDYGLLFTESLRLSSIAPSAFTGYDLVVADEYQDTAPAHAELLLDFAASADELVAAADPYQSIYSFRGADIMNVFSFPTDVERRIDTGVERLVLTTSFRVPEAILAAAVSVTARELPGGAGKVHSTRAGGTVACHEFATAGEEAEWIASDIERIHLVDGVPLERIAVFIRAHGGFVGDLTRALDRRRIAHTWTDERLADEPAVRFVHDLARASSDDDEAAVRRVLQGPFIGLGPGLVATLPDAPDRWPAWIRERGPHLHPLADLVEDDAWCADRPAALGLWHLWSSLPQLVEVATDPALERHRRAWSAYAQAVDRISHRAPDATLADQMELSERFDFEADALFDVSEGGVTVATLHGAKGTEFDAVYIADAVEGQLPDLRPRDSILGVRHLHPHLPTSTTDYVAFRLDEERRLAYTAMTRATSQAIWTATVAHDHGTGSTPSRFMRLVAPSTAAHHHDRALTPRSLIASVRRTVGDPAATPVQRLAGLVFLATATADLADPRDRYGVRERGTDTPIVSAPLTLTPSQASAFDTCPRRYAIEQFILTVDDDSPYQRIGSIIHDVLERAERTAVDAGATRSTIDGALRALHELWPESGFPDDHVGAAWRRRAERVLHALYEGWPSDAVPVALEHTVHHAIGGVSWRGRVDRVERAGSDLRIVDYKTSAKAMTVADAASSLQLGFYVIAARADPELAAMGDVTSASFWYPAAPSTRAGIPTRDFDMGAIDAVAERLVEITDAVAADRFPAFPNSGCGRCPVAGVCPAVPTGTEAFSP